jgi:hypothetical protein
MPSQQPPRAGIAEVTTLAPQQAAPLEQQAAPFAQQEALLWVEVAAAADLLPQQPCPSQHDFPLPFAIIGHLPSAQQLLLPSLSFDIIGQALTALPSFDAIAESPPQHFASLPQHLAPLPQQPAPLTQATLPSEVLP